MKVHALYGPSGTGKSTRALSVAHELNIPAIIDDGLLIYNGQKVAGTSAKYEKTKVASVKRAIFHDPEHREDVRTYLRHLPISSILIMGTSKNMVERIAERLGLPPIDHYISIEEVSRPQDVQKARFIRQKHGKHTIPISPVQVKRDMVGELIASVEQIFSKKKEPIGEHTIVYPPFHKNKITIHEKALKKLVTIRLGDFQSIHTIGKITLDPKSYGHVSVHLTFRMPLEQTIKAAAAEIQRAIGQLFEDYLNVRFEQVHIFVDDIHF